MSKSKEKKEHKFQADGEEFIFVVDKFILPGFGELKAEDLVQAEEGSQAEKALALLVTMQSAVIRKVKGPSEPSTVAQLKEALEALNVEVPSDAKKPDLVKLYEEAKKGGE